MRNYSFKDVANMLAQQAEYVASYLFPNGRRSGNEFVCGSVDGESGKSFSVCLSGPKAGVCYDFEKGEGGDMIWAWQHSRKITPLQALSEAKSYLGIKDEKINFYKKDNKSFTKPNMQIKNIIEECNVKKYLVDERKINQNTFDVFKISSTKDEIIFPSYRKEELIRVKYMNINRTSEGKKIINITKDSEPCLFGWQAVPGDARVVCLTEGEIDAMTLYQYGVICKCPGGENKIIGFLSVPLGGGKGAKHDWVQYEYEKLSIYDEIFLCMDNDQAGEDATMELVERLGMERCRIVRLPYKDANECLQKNLSLDEIQKCFDEAESLDPEELKSYKCFMSDTISEFYPPDSKKIGYSFPWSRLEDKVFLRPYELSIWTGINGHGKSTFLSQVILDNLVNGAKVCVASLEIRPHMTLKTMIQQATALTNPSKLYIEKFFSEFDDRFYLFDLVGTAKTKRLLEVFKYAKKKYGVELFVIDSFLKCGIAEDDFNAQKLFVEELCDFKNTYGVHVHLVAHPRKVSDETEAPGKLDVKGSGSITDLADNCFTIWKNKVKQNKIESLNMKNGLSEKEEKAKEDAVESPDCVFYCTKQRNGSWEGKMGFWFHEVSRQFLESKNCLPIRFVDYSSVGARNAV